MNDKELTKLIAQSFYFEGRTFPVTDEEIRRFCQAYKPKALQPDLVKRLISRLEGPKETKDGR